MQQIQSIERCVKLYLEPTTAQDYDVLVRDERARPQALRTRIVLSVCIVLCGVLFAYRLPQVQNQEKIEFEMLYKIRVVSGSRGRAIPLWLDNMTIPVHVCEYSCM